MNGSIYFQQESAFDQIEWTVQELKTNYLFYLSKSNEKYIRELRIDQNDLERALVSVRSKMIEFLTDIPELAGI